MDRITSIGITCAILLFSHSALQAQESEAKREAAFKRADTNSDSSLSKDEFMATKGAKKNPEGAAKRFTRIDKDGNGSLSKEEFTTASVGGKKNMGDISKKSEGSRESEE